MADKYWVGGTNNWAYNYGWSNVSGGSPILGYAPTSSDNAILDSNSGSGTVNVNTTASCNNLIMTGFLGTLTGGASGQIYIYGDTIVLSNSGIFIGNRTPALIIINPNTGATVNFTSNGQCIGNFNMAAPTANFVCQDDFIQTNNSVFQNSGIFNANGKNVTVGQASIGGTINMGSGIWTVGFIGDPLSPNTVFTVDPAATLNKDTATLRLLKYVGASGLKNSISDTDTSITVVETTGSGTWNPNGTILIDNEQISYASVSGKTLNGCMRGINGTFASAHSAGATVINITPPVTTLSTSISQSGTPTTIEVSDLSVFGNNAGMVQIDNEIFSFTGKTAPSSLTGIQRGYYNLTNAASGWATSTNYQAAHSSGSIVRSVECRYYNNSTNNNPPIQNFSNQSNTYTYFYGTGVSTSGGGIANISMPDNGLQTILIGNPDGSQGFNITQPSSGDFINLF